ncbi:hypothetical protein CQW49_01080 [Methylosinus trichosporium OB3b]|uniref:Uncharacterized protein n=2 Tax=Methylocystaceae TaxID=31993 RepID=A0A2D2CUZ9_METT3|nr:hypothetical protein CQW49_01080 [Methylosinus trichosporium OB3b]
MNTSSGGVAAGQKMSKDQDVHSTREESAEDDSPLARETTAAGLAAYIAELSGELALMAERADFTMLGYFLRLARVEAETKASELATPAPTVDGSGRA